MTTVIRIHKVKKSKSKNGLDGPELGTVGSGNRSVVGDTKETTSVVYPRYVFPDWFKPVSSRVYCVCDGVFVSLLFTVT